MGGAGAGGGGGGGGGGAGVGVGRGAGGGRGGGGDERAGGGGRGGGCVGGCVVGGRARAPVRNIAIVESHQVLPSLDELFAVARAQHVAGGHRGMINLISGPSRTADIEGQIVNGIHGPLNAHLVIVA